MALRDHEPIVIEDFYGLWDKGDTQSVPQDHFSDCQNVKFIGAKSFGTRDGVGLHQNVVSPLRSVLRFYNFITQDENTILVLVKNGTNGEIYHVVDSTTVFGPILTIAGMTDFKMATYAGRAYITPIASYAAGNLTIEKGMQNEFVYVYKGDGTPARKAGGNPASGTITVGNGAAGGTDEGFHLFGVVFETDTGFLSAPAGFAGFTTTGNLSVSFTNVPVSLQSFVTKRHIVATKVILDYNGNTTGYEYYFIPNATIPDNVSTSLLNVSFFDVDLLESASYLLDNFSEIPAGAVLGLYRNRLVLATTFDDISLAYLSAVGEPEAINQIDGLLIVPPDGNPLANSQELRDILYLFKRNRTVAYNDNDDVPSTWSMTVVDPSLGAGLHSVATVIDEGASMVDFLIIGTYAGIMMFNGRYIKPELSWKISNFWINQDKVNFKYVQILNDPIKQLLYVTLPDRRLLIGDYNLGMDPKNMRWIPWKFDFKINTVALVEINTLVLGSESGFV